MGYYTFSIPKKSGGVRTITAPDEILKKAQRELLKDIQNKFWISKLAHGFTKKRNILTNAKAHRGKRWILNLDIRDFFPSITWSLIKRVKQTDSEAASFESVPSLVFLYNGILPQGAPTSPFLSNYCMREFDTQILPLLRKLVSDDIEYTRYADDLTFSSNSRAIEKVLPIVESKLKSIGLELSTDKTRLAGRGQRQEITGLNINSGRPTIPKKYRRRVRALVHRASNGWIITHKQKERLLGMISHIALCHPEEAGRYRETLLAVKPIPDTARRFCGVKRIRLDTKAKVRTVAAFVKTNTSNPIRKLRRTTEL